MRHIFILPFIAIVALSGCKSNTQENEQRLRSENLELRQEIDSLKKVISKGSRQIKADTVLNMDSAKALTDDDGFAGKHLLTLQWISWDEPGSVNILPAENGWFTISGRQVKGSSYLKISGRIKPLNAQELQFDGEIETRIESINSGEPCLKTGEKIFKATGTRKYWRLQDMINCEGGTVDYIDIYF